MKISMIKGFRIVMLLGATWLMGCEDKDMPTLNQDAAVELTADETEVVLTADGVGTDVLTLTWPTPDYGFTAAPTYLIYLDKEGGDFSDAVVVNNGANETKTFKSEELNGHLLNLDFEAEVETKLLIKIVSRLTTNELIESEVIEIDATSYQAYLDLSTDWGVVGGAYNNWGNGPDAPFFTTSVSGVYVAYVKVRAGQIKFRTNQSWDVNMGDNGADGTLEAGGSDITVTAGTKKITFNTNNNTYTIEDYSWGIVGSAWNNWGNPQGTPTTSVVPDLDFYYDDSSDTWKAIAKLQAGQFKIRKNSDWGTNYGDNGADGTLDAGGTDITVAAGTYLITMDLNAMTYSIEPYDRAWGLVGSAYNNWGQDVAPANGVQDLLDAPFVRDWRTDGVYKLTNIVLQTGAFKIRDGNAWTIDFGDTGADGTLNQGGSDIAVTGGLHSITVDFVNNTISVVRHND